MIIRYTMVILFFILNTAHAGYETTMKAADDLNDNGYTERAYKKYKQSYSEASSRFELIKTFAALAVTANKLGDKYKSGGYIDRLRTISPKHKWSKKFVRSNNIDIPGRVVLIDNETYEDLMLSGDRAYANKKYQTAYINYLKGLSAASTLNQLIVSLASVAVASNETGRKKESTIYLKRLSYISPENPWAKSYAKKINAGDVNTITKAERQSIISNMEERTIRTYSYMVGCSKKPILACSPSEASSKAFAMCASVMGGCEAVQNDMGTDQRFVVDQACNALVNKMTGQKQTLESMLLTGVGTTISESAEIARDSEDLFSKLIFGTALTIIDLSFKATIFNQCRASAMQNCTRIYNEWKYSCQ